MEINWDDMKEILGKAAFGGLYAAAAELAISQSADVETLLIALGVAGIRGLIVFLQLIYASSKEQSVESKLSSWNLRDYL